MDPKLSGFSDYVYDIGFEDDAILSNSGFNYNIPSPDFSFIDGALVPPNSEYVDFSPSVSVDNFNSASSGWSPEGNSSSPSGDGGFSDPVSTNPYLKRISQMLMEDNMEDELWDDPFSLRDAEQSLYEVLGERNPSLTVSGNGSECGSHSHTSPSTSTGSENPWIGDVVDSNVSRLQVPLSNGLINMDNGLMETPSNEFMVKNMFSDAESILQFQKGLEEARKFLPGGDKLNLNPGNIAFFPNQSSNTVVVEEKNGRQGSPDGARIKKHREREDRDLEEERSTKQSASFEEETELAEMFDKVLLLDCKDYANGIVEQSKTSQKNDDSNGGGKTRSKRRSKEKEPVDLRALLMQCAQAVSSYDNRTAIELLKQIREHSSPTGNGSQRLAHYFANGLEARMEGRTRTKTLYHALTSRRISSTDALNAYKVLFNACPFKKLAIGFANKMICNIAENATALHVIDFGILYGYQWPLLIQLLSMRPGGPPKLRITGIDFPQSGFRPTERLEETGRRLAKYCERFNVPFKYNFIASLNWETIQLDELKIDRNEVLAVNNPDRFEDLLDETENIECPRDAVLKLIRSMNPDIFLHSVFSGSYNAPFFLTRFKEALFYFSSIYDMLYTNTHYEEPARMIIEDGFHGQTIMNVIACEGVERIHRPETYKQWNYRTLREKFKSLPLDRELMQMLRNKTKTDYHKDFVIDEDNNWMLQGWKGRILGASSCWVPA